DASVRGRGWQIPGKESGSPAEAGLPVASGRRGHEAPQLAECARLDLADALGRDAVLVGELVERRLVVGHPAPLHDVAAARIEPSQRPAQLLVRVVRAFG